MSHRREEWTRRQLLAGAGRALVVVPAGATLIGILGCGEGGSGGGTASQPDPTPAPAPTATPEPKPTPAPKPSARAPGEDALVTEIPAMAPQVTALQYVNESVKPDQQCANCIFYKTPGEARGGCQLFPKGKVAAQGWCASWAKRPA